MGILSKDMIEQYIIPHLSKGNRGPKPLIPLYQIVKLVLYRLESGCKWRQIPIRHFVSEATICWKTIYHHFRKWSKDGSWQKSWTNLLASNRVKLDMSCVQLDGSHTPAKKGGEAVGYQGRKASNTTNSLFLADNSGQMIAMSTPQEGSHHDLFGIEKAFMEMNDQLKLAGIDSRGIFLNADAGFDSNELRRICVRNEIEANIKVNPRNVKQDNQEGHFFDGKLYERRSAIERANAWIDGFRALINRFETTVSTWMALHWIAFSVLFIKKINKPIRIT
ncbi:MAG: IS5 family transposase [Thiothrix sp.]|nr:MAG: IS5 family transposase [Thiothrix sp.]